MSKAAWLRTLLPFAILSLAILALINFTRPSSSLLVALVIFLIGGWLHFLARFLAGITGPLFLRILSVYVPMLVSYLLFLSWQRIVEPILILPALVIIIILELFIRNVSI